MNLLFANDKAGEYPASYYAATAAPLARFPALKGAARADVCIIGGGYTGLSAALHLAQRGMDVLLIEAHRVGFGASGRNGGAGGIRPEQRSGLAGKDGRPAIRPASCGICRRKRWAWVKSLIHDHDMPCTFHSGLAHACWTDAEVTHARHYAEKLARDYGYEQITPLDRAGLQAILPSPVYKGGDIDRGAGHVHPLNYAIGLAQAAHKAGARIHEGEPVLKITQGAKPVVETASARVECDHLDSGMQRLSGGS